MAITLPGWLVEAMSFLGYDFPQTNEDVLHLWADLMSLDGTMLAAHEDLLAAVRHVAEHNHGPAADAFATYVSGTDNDARPSYVQRRLRDRGRGAAATARTPSSRTQRSHPLPARAHCPGHRRRPVNFVVKKAVEWAINRAISIAVTKLVKLMARFTSTARAARAVRARPHAGTPEEEAADPRPLGAYRGHGGVRHAGRGRGSAMPRDDAVVRGRRDRHQVRVDRDRRHPALDVR